MQRNAAGAEPIRDFADMLFAIGVVNVLTRAKNLDGLGSAADQFIEQARVKPLFDQDISGNRSQHISLSGRSPQILENIQTDEASVVRARESNHECRGLRFGFILRVLERGSFAFSATIAYDFLTQVSISELGRTSKLSSITHL